MFESVDKQRLEEEKVNTNMQCIYDFNTSLQVLLSNVSSCAGNMEEFTTGTGAGCY